MIKQILSTAVIAGALAVPFTGGCDKTVHEEKTTKVKDDGTVVKESEKVVKQADGDVVKTEKKSVDH